jgi:hypothetical protein
MTPIILTIRQSLRGCIPGTIRLLAARGSIAYAEHTCLRCKRSIELAIEQLADYCLSRGYLVEGFGERAHSEGEPI